MFHSGSAEYNHHLATFGDPYGNWPYHNFLNGANDKAGAFTKFAPKLKSAGGNFDPNEWAQLFADAGAKMAGPVAEHHDGFSMWKSTCNEWNSVSKGPGLDLVAQFAADPRFGLVDADQAIRRVYAQLKNTNVANLYNNDGRIVSTSPDEASQTGSGTDNLTAAALWAEPCLSGAETETTATGASARVPLSSAASPTG
jgi:hypothetical protein